MTDALARLLRDAGIENPHLEARWIGEEYPVLSDAQAESIVARRAAGEPLSRIFGWREFYGRRFDVTNDTLDPRPETETIIDLVRKTPLPANPRILDMGTGTGCVAITLALEIPGASVTACDISDAALAVAHANAARNNAAVHFVSSDWWDAIDGAFDVIVSNPPYIKRGAIPALDRAVTNHDPILALDGGDDGLDAYRKIHEGLDAHLIPGGVCFFEIGFDQGETVPRIFEKNDLFTSRIHADLAGHPRVVEVSRCG